MLRHRFPLALVATLGLMLGQAATEATDYTFTTLDAPFSGSPPVPYTQATGINDLGQIVGFYILYPSELLHVFLYDNGEFRTINGLDGNVGVQQLGINNRGQIVGAEDSSGHLVLYDKGEFTPIDVPGPPSAINNRGQVVGPSTGGFFLYNRGEVSTINAPLSFLNFLAINDRGQVVGPSTGGFFLYERGEFNTINAPLSFLNFLTPTAINDRGQIVGWYSDDDGYHGFLYERGEFNTIDAPFPRPCPGTVCWTFALGINNRGQIVGAYEGDNGRHGFLATPNDDHGGDDLHNGEAEKPAVTAQE